MPTTDLRQAYIDVLSEQLNSCRYPSPTMLDRLEESIRDRSTAEEYLRSLIEQTADGRYPSPMMLERIAGLLDALDRRGARPA